VSKPIAKDGRRIRTVLNPVRGGSLDYGWARSVFEQLREKEALHPSGRSSGRGDSSSSGKAPRKSSGALPHAPAPPAPARPAARPARIKKK
jgi:hypothetical protein